MNIIMQ